MTEEHKLGDAPIQEEYRTQMLAVAEALNTIFNGNKKGRKRTTGFVLMVFPFTEFDKGDSRCNFISNGVDRKDVVALMKEMIARFEGQPDVEGHA
jgi:hypothetical protein